MPKSPAEMEASMIENFKEKTGKTLPEWIKVAKASGLAKHGEIVKHLKSDHGMTHGYANFVALKALADGAAPAAGKKAAAGAKGEVEDPADELYTGAKAGQVLRHACPAN